MVKEWKVKKVEEIAGEISRYKYVMVTDMTGIPAKQLMDIREGLRDKLRIVMSKKSLLSRALEKAGYGPLVNELKGSPALLLSNEDPFSLSITLDKKKVPSFAKPGTIAEEDIYVRAGPTEFAPGPILSEFGKFGIKTKIEGGKINIVKDALLVKKGEEINEEKASLLKKLGIMPVKLGLKIIATLLDGKIYRDVHVDVKDYEGRVEEAHSQAFSLAFNANILTKETSELLLSEAHSQALSLAVNAKIYNEESLPILLSLANAHASSLGV